MNKNISKAIYAILFTAIMAIQFSCSKDIFSKTNDNPNAPPTVTPGNILPGVQTALAYTQGGDYTRFSDLFVQQMVGISRQSQAYYQYILTSTDMNTVWGNLYTSVLGNAKDMMNKADAAGYNEYSGISRIITAYGLQLLVDGWGDVPYSQAFKGADNTHPVYDKASALYDTIENLVNVAIAQLNNADPGAQTPGTDDLLFGGDATKWIKFGHAIKARLYIHQSKGDATMAANALTEANLSFSSISDNAEFVFGNTETFANPIYEFNEQRGDIDYASGYLPDLLNNLTDPRLDKLITPDYSDVNFAGIASYYGDINGHVEFITYDEIEFIKAEATLRSTGNVATAQTYYQAGIQASMDKLGVGSADAAIYITANGTLPVSSTSAIAAVAQQEYIDLYQNPEAWTLWRRTGVPNLTPVTGTNGIPRRFLYPQNEYSLNAANVPQATLFAPKIFWDK